MVMRGPSRVEMVAEASNGGRMGRPNGVLWCGLGARGARSGSGVVAIEDSY